jgi:hypothetical protein
MGITTGTQIINDAAIQLNDVANVRWPRTELLEWLNSGQAMIVLMQPSANATFATQQMTPGTRQLLPADGWSLLNITRNLLPDGVTPGRAVRVVSRTLLDAQNSMWHAAPAVSQVQNYIYDMQEPTAFYVYPPSDGTCSLEYNYAAMPAPLATEAGTIDINDVYAAVILDYILYRANSKDAEYAAGIQLAAGYWQSFKETLGFKDKSDATNNPNQSLTPKTQATPGAIS